MLRLQTALPDRYSTADPDQLTRWISQAKAELTGDSMEDRLASLEKEDEVERLLADLKSKRGLPG